MKAVWRRTFRVLAYAAGAIALLLALLHTPPAKEGLRRVVAAMGGGRVELGELDYRLWRGEIEARDVVWTSPTLTARVPELHYRYTFSGPELIEIHGPEIALSLEDTEASGAGFAIPAFLLGRAVVIDEGALRVQASWGSLELRAIDVTLTPSRRGWEGSLDAPSGTVRLEAFSDAVDLDGAEARLVVSSNGVEIEEARVTSGASSVSTEGDISSFSPFSMALDVTHDVDGQLLARIAAALQVGGSIEGDARLSIEPGGSFRAEGTAASDALVYDDLEPIAATVPWRFDSDVLEVRAAELEGYGGSARLNGTADLASDRQTLEASLRGVELGRLDPRLASRLDATGSASTAGWALGALDATGRVELTADPARAGLPLRGTISTSAAGGVVRFDAPAVRVRSLRIAASGRFDGQLDARFRATEDRLDALPVLLRDLGLEPPDTPLEGSLTAEGSVAGPASDLAVGASVTSSGLVVAGVPLELTGRARWAASRLTVEEVAVRQSSGGALFVEGSVPAGEEGGSWDLTARAEAFDLSVASALAGRSLEGALDGEARVTGSAALPEIEATFNARGLAVADVFTGDVSGVLRERDRKLEIVKLSASRDGAVLELEGQLDLGAETMTARGSGSGWDLSWVPPLAKALPELRGRIAELAFDVEGRVEAPEGRVSATLDAMTFRDAELPTTSLELLSNGETARVEARLTGGAELLTGDVELRAPYPARVEVDVARVPWTALLRTFPEAEAAIARLEIDGTAELRFPLTEPSALSYTLRAASALVTYRELVFGASAPFSVRGDLETFTVDDLTLVGSDTAVEVDGVLPLSAEGPVDVAANGAFRLELLQLWMPESESAGQMNATIRVQGTLAEPTLEGDVVVEGASAVLGGVPVRSIDAAARWIDNVLVLQHASGSLLDGSFEINGEIAPRVSGEIHTRLEFRIEGTNPASLVETELPFEDARLSLSGEIEGDARRPSSFDGRGAIEELQASTGSFALASDGSSPWTLTEGALSLPRLRITGGSTDVVLAAEARPFADPPTWSASVDGVLDHGLLSPFLADTGVNVSGLTLLTVSAHKEAEGLTLEGNGSWSGARIAILDPPLVITNVTGRFQLSGDRMILDELSGAAGGGRVTASGEITISDASIASLDLSAVATQVRLSYPEGLRSELDADLKLTGTPEAMRLAGTITLDRAVFSRNINVETELLRSFTSVSVASAPTDVASRVRLDLTVRAEDALRVDNNLAQLGATANLTVAGTLAAPELYGVVFTQQGGRFRFGRNLYQIETGRIQFQGYPQQPPEIDVTARTSVGGHDLRLSASGTTDNLVTNLDAPNEPGLTRADVASLLVTGRTADKLSSEGRTAIGEQMTSYLGATLADLAQLGLGEALPFQLTTVEPALIAREVDPGARFTIGAAFTEELTVVYSIGLSDAEQQFWLVDYALPKRARAQLIRQDNNEYTFGVLQQLPFYVRARPTIGGETEPRTVVGSTDIVYGGEDRPEAAEDLQRHVRPSPGSRYDYWRVWEEADRIRRRLREEGYLEATVDVATSSCGEACVDVRYDVDLGLPVAFLWKGEVDDELGDALAEAWNGRLGESFLTSDLEQLALGELFARGYFLARAEASTQRTDQGLTVTVAVERGPRGRRVALTFPGREGVDDDALLAALPERRSSAFYDLLTVKRPRLKQSLRLVYASRGYLAAEVGDPETRFDEAEGVFHVSIPVLEGRLFRVEAVELQGVAAFSEDTLRALLPLRAGGVFRATDFVHARAALAAYYRQQGFPDVEVEASLVDGSTEGSLGARFVVTEGARATVGQVTVAGNDATRESVIRREIALEQGEPLRLSDVSDTQRQLYDLDVFRSAEVVVGAPQAEDSHRDVTVRVVEASDLRLDYGFRAGTDGFFEVLGEVNALNLFGRAHHAGFRTLIGSERKIFRFNYHSPYLSRYKLDTDFFVERAYETLTPAAGIASQDRTWKFTAQQTRLVRKNVNAQWSYSYQRAVSDFEDPFFGPTTISLDRSILTGSMIGDARNSVVRPSRGTLWSATFQAAPQFLRSDAQFVKLFSQLYHYVSLGDGFVWASSYRVGLAKLLSDTLLREDRFQAGGPNTVRGFAQGSLGPVNEDVQAVIGGAGLLIFNQELRFPLFWRLRGAGFWDAGNTFETVAQMRLGDLRHDVGLGARLDLPFGLLRLDWAWVVAPRPGEDPWRFVFSLGQAF